ncbi:6-phosphogluconate dehydrogenase C-terminal domain-like protein [Ramaria rubella]|nr:6-phosphogluconate dehydrogenase C-terminal domain-like protein [Ramaria rubella]
MSNKKEVLVVGFGAVGVMYSFIIKHGGKANVTCVARSNYEATRENGIHIKSRTYGDVQGWKPDRLFKTVDEAADRPYSYVIVATKSLPEINPTALLLAPLLSSNNKYPLPAFVIMQNGLFVERDLYAAIKRLGRGEPSIISTAVWIGSNVLEGNVVEQSHPERMSIGIYREEYASDVTNTAQETAILQDFSHVLEASGSPVRILDEVQRIKFRKNFWNAAFGCCAALVRHPLPAFFLEPSVEANVVPQIRAMMLEVLAVGRAMGFDENALPSDVVENTIESTAKIHKSPDSVHRPSMLMDVEHDRPTELEVILGELIKKAKELHVDAPRLELVYSLISVIQNQVIRR